MNIVKNKKQKNKLFWVLPVLVAVFFVLPVVFPDQGSHTKTNFEEQEEGSLPVVASGNPLSKYFSKVAGFYGGGKNRFQQKNTSLVDYATEVSDARSAYGDDNLIFSYDENGNINGILPNAEGNMPDFMSLDGNDIIPADNGYYYNNVFYPNGSYPSNVNARKVENALLKYYKAVAAQSGKVAAYERQPDGSLSVAFFTPEKMSQMQSGMPSSGGEAFSAYVADAGRYNGATLASRSESKGASAMLNGGISAGAELGDRYAAVDAKFSGLVKDSTLGYQEPDKKEDSGDGSGQEEANFDEMAGFNRSLYRESRTGDEASLDRIPKDFKEKFNNTPIVYKNFSQNMGVKSIPEILSSLGLGSPDEGKTSYSLVVNADDVKKAVGDAQFFRYFSTTPISLRRREEAALKIATNKEVFYEPLRPVFFKYQNVGTENPDTFKSAFYERTGLKNIVVAANFGQAKQEELEKSYDVADAIVSDIRKSFKKELMQRPEIFKGIKPQVVFPLGVDKNTGNITIATAESHLYAYAPQAIPAIARDAADKGKTYVGISREDFKRNFSKRDGVAAVTNSLENQKVLREAGIATVAVISDEQLTSLAPKDIKSNAEIVGRGVIGQEIKRILDDSNRKKFEEAVKKADIAKTVKDALASVNGKKTGAAQSGKGSASATSGKNNAAKSTANKANGNTSQSGFPGTYKSYLNRPVPDLSVPHLGPVGAQSQKQAAAPKQTAPQKQAAPPSQDDGFLQSTWSSIKRFFGTE